MKNIDDEIRAALSEEDRMELERLTGEQDVFDMIGDTFRSKMRNWVILLWVESFAIFAAAVWTGYRFFNAPDARDMIFWGSITIVLVLAIVIIKIWYWMEINKNTVVREVKRLELQIAYLAKSMANK